MDLFLRLFFLTHHQKKKNYKYERFAQFLQKNINFLTVSQLRKTGVNAELYKGSFSVFFILFLINSQFSFFTSLMFRLLRFF